MKEMALKLLAVVALVLAPIKAIMYSVGALVVADLVTGIAAAHKRGEKITSQGLKRSVVKTLVYQLAVIIGMVVDNHLIPGIGVLKVVSGLIAVTEVKSIAENIKVLTGIDVWAALQNKLNDLAKHTPAGDENDKKAGE